MERIKQALEKARLERQKANSGSSVISGVVRGARAEKPLVYTHTRIVELDRALLQDKRIISALEQSPYSDAYKILRTQVLQRLQEKGLNSLAVTSAGMNEGRTLTAINLAISLAMEVNYTVLLVDADLRHPGVHTQLGLDAQYGLSDFLTQDKPLTELLIHPSGIPRLVILPGGKPLINSAEMLNSPKMVSLVEELKTRYPSRIILFDLPPLLNTADALAFSPYVDAALLVIEEGKTQADDVKHAMDLLQGTHVLGTVLNKSWNSAQQGENLSIDWANQFQGRMQILRAMLASWFSRLRRKMH